MSQPQQASSFRTLGANSSQQAKINEYLEGRIAFQAPQLPVKVIEVNIEKNDDGSPAEVGSVDVQPLVSMQDASGKAVEHATIYEVPYFRQQAGSQALVIDPKKGDLGFIVIAGRDISNVLSAKDVSAPASFRMNHFQDAVYIPSMLCAKPDEWIQATENGWRIHAKDSNTIELNVKDSTLTINSDKATISCDVEIDGNLTCKKNLQVQGKITAQGNITSQSGDIIASGISLKNHTHSNGNEGAPTGAPIP